MKNEKKTASIIAFVILIAFSMMLCSCSHNQGSVIAGKGFIIGGNGIQYYNGVVVLDNSRENSSWKIELSDDDSAKQGELGQAKSVKSIERKIGKQVTGYLAELDKEVQKEYVKECNHTGEAEK